MVLVTKGPAFGASSRLLVAGLVLLPLAIQDRNAVMVAVESVILLAASAEALWLVLRGADNFRIRLAPDGLRLPSGWGTVRSLTWGEIEGAQAVSRWQPVLVVIPKDTGWTSAWSSYWPSARSSPLLLPSSPWD